MKFSIILLSIYRQSSANTWKLEVKQKVKIINSTNQRDFEYLQSVITSSNVDVSGTEDEGRIYNTKNINKKKQFITFLKVGYSYFNKYF